MKPYNFSRAICNSALLWISYPTRRPHFRLHRRGSREPSRYISYNLLCIHFTLYKHKMCKKLDYWWRSKAKHHTKSWAYWSLEFFPSSSSASSSLCFDLLSLHTLHSTNIKQICSMLLLDLRGLLSWLMIWWWWGLRWCWSVTLYSLHLKVNIEWRHFKSCHRSIEWSFFNVLWSPSSFL